MFGIVFDVGVFLFHPKKTKKNTKEPNNPTLVLTSFCQIVINYLLYDWIGCTCIIAVCKFPSWSHCLMQYIWLFVAEKGEIGEIKIKIIECGNSFMYSYLRHEKGL